MKKKEIDLIIMVLELMRDFTIDYSIDGLCGALTVVCRINHIIPSDRSIVYKYMRNHRPEKGDLLADELRLKSLWWWEPYKRAPRIKWLDHHIEKLKKYKRI